MMTEEALYARLREALRDAIARHHLDERSISLKSRGLTPEEAIGRTARTDYPILNGREVMLQARFGGALGQAFTSAPVDFEGSLADVLALDTAHDPQAGGMLVATLNAVLRAVGDTKRPLYCLAAAGIINVVLNLVFVIGFSMSVAGVALATIISPGGVPARAAGTAGKGIRCAGAGP